MMRLPNRTPGRSPRMEVWGYKPTLVLVGLGLIAAVAGCGSGRRGVPLTEPVNLSDPHIARGQLVFMNYCNQCHPGGAAGLAPPLNNRPLPGALIRFQVRNGLGAMPAFGEQVISDEELDNLLAYLKALRRTG